MSSRTQQDDYTTSSAEKKPVLSNLAVRTLTAIILIPVVLLGVNAGGWIILLLIIPVAVIGLLEFFMLARGRESQGSALVGIPMAIAVLLSFNVVRQPGLIGPFHSRFFILSTAILIGVLATATLEAWRHPGNLRRTFWQVVTTLAGVLYIAFPLGFLLAIRSLDNGLMWILVVFAATWATDTFAYFGGRRFGKRKLAPVLSPSKTVEGAVIGLVMGFLFALMFLALGDNLSGASLVMIAIAPFFAEAGDLFESAMKRFFKVKDSHVQGLNIIPGHGGVLDRIDSLLAVSAFCYLFMLVTGIS